MTTQKALYDISVELSEQTPVWPGGTGFKSEAFQTLEDGYDAAVSIVRFDVHSGTHIDAPAHFVLNGRTIDSYSLNRFIGSCFVLDCSGTDTIDKAFLLAKNIPANVDKLLLKTNNSINRWYNHAFNENYVALTNNAAHLLVSKGIKLIGIDGPSIQKYTDPKDTHITFLENDVLILEGVFLGEVGEGAYDIYCPPVKVIGREAMSVRAVLISTDKLIENINE